MLLSYFSHCCDQIPEKKEPKEGSLYMSPVGQSAVHHGEATSNQKGMAVLSRLSPFPLFYAVLGRSPWAMPSTFRVGLQFKPSGNTFTDTLKCVSH